MSVEDYVKQSEQLRPDTPLPPAEIAALRLAEEIKLKRNATERLGHSAMFKALHGTKAVIVGTPTRRYEDMRSRMGASAPGLHIAGVRYLLPDQDAWSEMVPVGFAHKVYDVMPGSITYNKEDKSVVAVTAADEAALAGLRVALCYRPLNAPEVVEGRQTPPEDRGEATETISLISSVQEVVPFARYYSDEAYAGIPLLKLEAN